MTDSTAGTPSATAPPEDGSTPMEWTAAFVEAASGRVHTYESWARAVVAEAMRRAAGSAGFDSDGATVAAEISIKPPSDIGRDPSTNLFGSTTCGGEVELLGVSLHVDVSG